VSIQAEQSEPAAPGRGGLFHVFRQERTYRSLLYLALAWPLGWAYWLVFSEVFRIGIDGSLVAFVPFVALVLAASWYVAAFERELAGGLLGLHFAPMAPQQPAGISLWERIKAHLRNPVTWKALAYLGARILFGVAAPVAALVLVGLCLLLILAPLVYAAAAVAYAVGTLGDSVAFDTPWGPERLGSVLGVAQPQGHLVAAVLAVVVVCCVAGILALPGALRLLNGAVWLWGRFTRVMLGMSERDLWLAEARAIAARAEARADQADRSRRELILNASHELRTPIASIRAHIESLLILEGEQLPEHVRAFLGITQREAERLGALVDELLELARADADGLRLRIQPVVAAEVVEEVYQALEPLAQREREVTLVCTVAPDLPSALADRDRLAQVLLNLVRNAITYTPRGGVVSIDLAAGAPGCLELTVTDTGAGIPPEDLERIFERFYRTDASRARGTGGFGLGLAIVRDLVRAMGGTVVAERVPEGGSRFRVTLRAVPAAVPAQV
jgi:signal transduction histidine kinase